MVKVTAVVVTYNRVNLLQRVVKALESQTIELYKIFVVNNGSTDGTKEWLDSQTNLTVIHQDNVGGSGGFYRGIKEASKEETDWIWCMDDDQSSRQIHLHPNQICLQSVDCRRTHCSKHKNTSFENVLLIMEITAKPKEKRHYTMKKFKNKLQIQRVIIIARTGNENTGYFLE